MTLPVSLPTNVPQWTAPDVQDIESAAAFYLSAKGVVPPQPWIIAAESPGDQVGYMVINTDEPTIISGASGLATSRIQFSCFSDTYKGMVRLYRQVRSYLQGFRGVVGSVEIDIAWIDSDSDHSENPKEGQEKPRFHRDVDVNFNWRIPVPSF